MQKLVLILIISTLFSICNGIPTGTAESSEASYIEAESEYEEILEEYETDGADSDKKDIIVEVKSQDTKERCSLSGDLFDNTTNQCYKGGTRGPCGTYMLFRKDTKGSQFGTCSCIFNENRCDGKFNGPIARSEKDGLCYPVYEQANCNTGEWFIINEDGDGVCDTNPCLNTERDLELDQQTYNQWLKYLKLNYTSRDATPKLKLDAVPEGVHPWDIDKPKWYLYNGKCFKTFTRGHCKGEDEIAIYYGVQLVPRCVRAGDFSHACLVASVLLTEPLGCPNRFKKHGHDCVAVPLSEFFEEE